MGLFDDIAYGIGASKEKPAGYDERTANSIEQTRGRDEADRYRADKGIERPGGFGSTFTDPDTGREFVVRDPSIQQYASSGGNPFKDIYKDYAIGSQYKMGQLFGDGRKPEDVSQEDFDDYIGRTFAASERAKNNFMGTGLTQQEYARGQQYGFSTGSDGQLTAQDRYGPEPTIKDPNAPDPTDPESTIFNPNNAFLRNRMRMQQEQGGGILPPAGGTQPTPPAPPAPSPPQMPTLPSPPPMPNMPPQLQGIMGLADRSNISPAMRYAAENYYRLGGRQMMNDEFERGRSMIHGQGV
jgi:hypothetical protein